MTQINPMVFSWVINTSPKAPLPSFYSISKSYNLIYLAFFIDIFSFKVNSSLFGVIDYLEGSGLVVAISGGGSNSFFFLN